MSNALAIIGWLTVITAAIWSTFTSYIAAKLALVGWGGRVAPVMLLIAASALWWLVWATMPFSIHWEVSHG